MTLRVAHSLSFPPLPTASTPLTTSCRLSQTVEELAVGEEQEGAFLFWYYVAMVVFLILMAGLMSGLTLGLMSLDSVDLEVGGGVFAGCQCLSL